MINIFYTEKDGLAYVFTARIDKYLLEFEKKTGCKAMPTGLKNDVFGREYCREKHLVLYTRKELEDIFTK